MCTSGGHSTPWQHEAHAFYIQYSAWMPSINRIDTVWWPALPSSSAQQEAAVTTFLVSHLTSKQSAELPGSATP